MSLDRRTFLGWGLSGLALAGGRARAALGRSAAPEAADPAARWGMVVDVRKCLQAEGCRDCIAACHAAHNVPVLAEPAHEVKWIWRDAFERVFPGPAAYVPDAVRGRSVPIFCNHCDNPPCVRVCPTQATWRRADGLVMMDWHRCIGCRYCMAACPYGSRSFNWVDPRPRIPVLRADFPSRTGGVVEKCNFCEERLARHEAPACLLACREKALTFGNLRDAQAEVRALLRGRYGVRRRAELGTEPAVFYLL